MTVRGNKVGFKEFNSFLSRFEKYNFFLFFSSLVDELDKSLVPLVYNQYQPVVKYCNITNTNYL